MRTCSDFFPPGTHLWFDWSWSVGPVCWCCSKWPWTHTLVWLCFHIDMPPRWHRGQTRTAPATLAQASDQTKEQNTNKTSLSHLTKHRLEARTRHTGHPSGRLMLPGVCASADTSGIEDTAVWSFNSRQPFSSLWQTQTLRGEKCLRLQAASVLSLQPQSELKGSSALPTSVSLLWIKCALGASTSSQLKASKSPVRVQRVAEQMLCFPRFIVFQCGCSAPAVTHRLYVYDHVTCSAGPRLLKTLPFT